MQFLKDDYTVWRRKPRRYYVRHALLRSHQIKRYACEFIARVSTQTDILRYSCYCSMILKALFDYDALNAYSMKMTRDAEYDLVHEMEAEAGSWSSNCQRRLKHEPARISRDMAQCAGRVTAKTDIFTSTTDNFPSMSAKPIRTNRRLSLLGLIPKAPQCLMCQLANAMCCFHYLITRNRPARSGSWR